MKRILNLLALAVAFAATPAYPQTQQKAAPTKAPAIPLKAKLAQVEARNAELQKAYDEMAALLGNQITELEARNKNLEAANKDTEIIMAFLGHPLPPDQQKAALDRAKAALTDLSVCSPEIAKEIAAMLNDLSKFYAQAIELQEEYKKLSAAHDSLVSQYNNLLSQANTLLQTANARLARQQQIYNALAIYSLMPKYQPPIRVQVMDCTRLPALCVQ